jgi:hypothetical protein
MAKRRLETSELSGMICEIARGGEPVPDLCGAKRRLQGEFLVAWSGGGWHEE